LKKTVTARTSTPISLGENPVNNFHAREYAKESSPSIVAVLLELTENARDNGTEVTLNIDVESHRSVGGCTFLRPKRIICTDNGTGLTHQEFLEKFCGAYSESESHHEIDRAGRNGVGTKTYLSIADRVLVTTTTGRPTEGLDKDREIIAGDVPKGLLIPNDGDPDTLWRVYEFQLHTRWVLPTLWNAADELEMGTQVELCELHEGAELPYEVLLERMSYAREWLQNPAHTFTIQVSGNAPTTLQKRLVVKPWTHPVKNWLVEARGNSNEDLAIFDPTTKGTEKVSARDNQLAGLVEFDFRVVGKTADGQMQNLEKPALLLEICGALPYPPNLDGNQSTRTLPLLTFLGLEHASSIGAFCNAVCGYARINALPLKQALRNNKTTLVSGPGAQAVEGLRDYLQGIFKILHRAWYNATRSSQDEAARDAQREAEEEVNLALKGVNRSLFREGVIVKTKSVNDPPPPPPPSRRHRWECGSCGMRWMAIAGFSPKACAETSSDSGIGEGCGSTNIGLAKNQPRIGDCQIRIEQLGDRRLPAIFQFEHIDQDLDVPVVRINLTSPRYIELRGTGSMSAQAQKRLKQYLVDVSLVGIAEYYAKTRGTDFSEEWGELYFNRMLRAVGIKTYESQLTKVLAITNGSAEESVLV
jgi:hypothetical protein